MNTLFQIGDKHHLRRKDTKGKQEKDVLHLIVKMDYCRKKEACDSTLTRRKETQTPKRRISNPHRGREQPPPSVFQLSPFSKKKEAKRMGAPFFTDL